MRNESKQEKPSNSLAGMSAYIAAGNPAGIKQLARSYGYPEVRTYNNSLQFLRTFLKREGEKAFDDLIMLHPDREVILEVYQSKHPQKIEVSSFMPESNRGKFSLDPKDKKSMLNALGRLVIQRKPEVVRLLAQYNTPVIDPSDVKEISFRMTKLLQKGNKPFTEEIATLISDLTQTEDSHFLDLVSGIVSGIGSIFGGGKKEPQSINQNTTTTTNQTYGPNANAVTLAALEYKMNKQKQEAENARKDKELKAKQQSQYIWLGATGAFVIVIIVVAVLFLK